MYRACRLVLPVCTVLCALPLRAQQARSEYEAWIRPYRAGPLQADFGDQPSEVKLKITAIEGDEKKPDNRADRFSDFVGYSAKYGSSVSMAGRISFFAIYAMGARGGGYPTMPEADLKTLNELLADLPDDLSTLPPPNRRLVLQVATADGVLARVYDRANAPDSVTEILRLAQSDIRSFVPNFPPQDQWKADEFNSIGAFARSPDGAQVISAGFKTSRLGSTLPSLRPACALKSSSVPAAQHNAAHRIMQSGLLCRA